MRAHDRIGPVTPARHAAGHRARGRRPALARRAVTWSLVTLLTAGAVIRLAGWRGRWGTVVLLAGVAAAALFVLLANGQQERNRREIADGRARSDALSRALRCAFEASGEDPPACLPDCARPRRALYAVDGASPNGTLPGRSGARASSG